MSKLLPYHQNFIEGVKLLMAEKNIESIKAAGRYLVINQMTMWKIMDGSNKPTVEQCLKLLKKGNYSANWLFLNAGDKCQEQIANFDSVIAEIKNLRTDLKAFAPTKKISSLIYK